MKYNLAALAQQAKPRGAGTALFPVIQPQANMEPQFLRILRKVQAAAARGIIDVILPAYRRATPVNDHAGVLVQDADETAYGLFRALVQAQTRDSASQLTQLLKLQSQAHTKEFMAQARRTFGVNLASVVSDEDLTAYLEQASMRAANLVTAMGDDLIKRIAQATSDSLISGGSAAKLQSLLKEQLEISDSRARLIARDQTAKLTSDLNRRRHQDAGVESYIWRTSQDERVRSRHRPLDGNVYEYGKPTGAEGGAPPGQPIQCRCIAQGVVDFGEAKAQITQPAPLKPEEVFNIPPVAAPPPKPKAPPKPKVPKPAPAPKPTAWEQMQAANASKTQVQVNPDLVEPAPAWIKDPVGGGWIKNPVGSPAMATTPKTVAAAVPKPKPAVVRQPTLTKPTVRGHKAPTGTVGVDVSVEGGHEMIQAGDQVGHLTGARYHSGKTNTHVREYISGSDWREFNQNLREGNILNDKQSKQAHALDQIVGNSRLKKPTVVYRGVSRYASNLVNLDVGDAFIDPSFMSTSIRPDVSQGFAGDDGVLMRILLPKGHRGAIIGLGDDIESSIRYEAELLLGRGTHLRVVSTSMEDVAGQGVMKVLDLEVVPNG